MARATRTGRGRPRRRGFTLIELIVVMAIIGILASIGLPHLVKAPVKAREAALREDLFTFRSSLDQFYADKGHFPATLDDLVTEKYMRKIPSDPITKSADTWVLEFEEPDSTEAGGEAQAPGIVDVKSGSTANALDGTPYNTW